MLDSLPIVGWLLRLIPGRKRRPSLGVTITLNGDVNDSIIVINIWEPNERTVIDADEIEVGDDHAQGDACLGTATRSGSGS